MAEPFTKRYTKDSILQDFICKASRTMTDMGIDDDTASRIATSLACQISEDWGGQLIYITKRQALQSRDLNIYTEFDGTNYKDLAARYHLSVRSIRLIIESIRKCLTEQSQT